MQLWCYLRNECKDYFMLREGSSPVHRQSPRDRETAIRAFQRTTACIIGRRAVNVRIFEGKVSR